MTEPAYTYAAEVIRWIDGDTVDLKVDLGFHMWAQTRFRLHGIDTPERGQPGFKEATAAANALAPPGSTVVLESFKDGDKFGRWLGVITASGETACVNDVLVDEGYAKAYFGGPR